MFKPTIEFKNGVVRLIDQTQLPEKLVYIECGDIHKLWKAVKRLSVRGAPALGMAAAYGVLLGTKTFRGKDPRAFKRHIHKVCDYLATSRPTAVNLFYGLEVMKQTIELNEGLPVSALIKKLFIKAEELLREDQTVCRAMGRHGAGIISQGGTYLTVCNAGALATVDYGTALGVFYAAKAQKKSFTVYSCETRPLLQGARLTCWELKRAKIPVTLICDNMAATLFQQKKINAVFTGADRIAANGDAANKIGTYNLAVLAKYHKIPFYVVAPLSTFDMKIKSGKEIPIEERSPDEVTHIRGKIVIAPKGINVYNPAFDVTPNNLITGIVTEKGILQKPFRSNMKKYF
ncbi:MAG: S-methyl-5-thioribose-1-phosphate isomerase [Candidatus Omnitrophica bacterium]|nr:S-methyl-5-thioribose-1-phosphate isomerase [Candidatus Omnitrophota bacterium]